MADDILLPIYPILAPPVPVAGIYLIEKDVFVYSCPLCGNQFRYDDPYEPMCTGPDWTDSHSPEVMRLIKKDTQKVIV